MGEYSLRDKKIYFAHEDGLSIFVGRIEEMSSADLEYYGFGHILGTSTEPKDSFDENEENRKG